ncbi:cell-cycle control medial ring component [Cladorrhinum samala]|uniref:Cell-cycle control medial ring component n=1 Tax=Cladorrhinum samala TaxID=585594 RepID=A0AAV9I0G7_9PEZI|nr:cell-cycle control medial ring component [Cladorrhinum samala]
MATEIAFAKSFLAQLDAKPSKIGPDHVEDARNYPGGNAFLLPRYASSPPLPKRRSGARSSPSNTASSASASSTTPDTVQVHATSARNPPLSLKFPNLALPTTSLLDVKQLVSNETGIPLAKIKLLFNKKPVGDTKVLKDLYTGQGGAGEVEIGIMVIGGAASMPAKQQEEVPPQQPPVDAGTKGEGEGEGEGEQTQEPVVVAPGVASGKEVMRTDEFWEDLRGFLEQRVKDEKVAREVVEQWKGSWTA